MLASCVAVHNPSPNARVDARRRETTERGPTGDSGVAGSTKPLSHNRKADEPADTPDSVEDGHPSREPVAEPL